MLVAALLAVATARPELFGLTRVKCPAGVPHALSGCAQLVSVDVDTGKLTNIGQGHNPLAAVGDLRVVANGVYYVLADNCGQPCNASGTVLLGISLSDGSEVCRADVPSLAEVGLVGGGQSLSHDTKNGRLVLTGPNSTDGGQSYTHRLLTAPLATQNGRGGSCGPFTRVGEFGDADFEPMAHGSELDADGQRLFVTLSTGAHSYGMGVIDVSSAKLIATFPMDSQEDTMWGPTFLPTSPTSSSAPATAAAAANSRMAVSAKEADGRGRAAPLLVGVGSAIPSGIDWRSLDPQSGHWTSTPLKYAPGVNVTFPGLMGNLGSVRAFDRREGVLYVMAGRGDPGAPAVEIVKIDVASGTLVAHSGALTGDTGISGSILSQLSLSPSAP
jgi:hypothetical protein